MSVLLLLARRLVSQRLVPQWLVLPLQRLRLAKQPRLGSQGDQYPLLQRVQLSLIHISEPTRLDVI
eukprot:3581276-Prorocentrum_lima.AAC.1